MWHELSIYQPLNPCCAKEQEKYLEVQHIYDLLGGLNPEYETLRAQILSQDPLPSIGTVFALVQCEEGRHVAMSDSIPSIINSERSALAMTNPTGRGDGGRGRGRGNGIRGGGRGGRGRGGPPGVDRDKLHCTHCGRTRHTKDTCWNLHGRPPWVNTAFAAETSYGNTGSTNTTGGKGELNVNEEIQALRQEFQASCQRLQALESKGTSHSVDVGSYSAVGTSHMAAATTSSTPSWVIDSDATNHVTGSGDREDDWWWP